MPTVTQVILLSSLSIILIWLVASHHSTPTRTPTPHRNPNTPPTTSGKPAFRQRLIAVGDLHGDIENAQKVLGMAKIIDSNSNWIGGTDILVQTGDIVDRGTYAFDIYRMMQRLRGQADGQGGRVVSVLGNHEVMNAIGDWRIWKSKWWVNEGQKEKEGQGETEECAYWLGLPTSSRRYGRMYMLGLDFLLRPQGVYVFKEYVTQDDIKHTGGTQQRMRDLSIDGWLGQEWLANYSVTALVPLGPHPSAPTFSFTHGSLRPSYTDLLPYPDQINSLGHSLLVKALTPPLAPPYPPNPYSGLPKGHTQAEAALYDAGGPLWWRGLAETQNEKTVCEWADQLRTKLGVRRVIGGHTPDFEKIVDRCNASIIIIDTGISSAYGGVLSALEIVYTLTPIDITKDRDRNHRQDPLMADHTDEMYAEGLIKGHRYLEREVVTAIYAKKTKLLALEEREITL
ncbi:Metallo-dependent phosphatase-like protein [Naematelia encephala]|uniref:Metallo-dependent phosphatase-like protein n=1 Tax=Naematelia encephala TaxID=71784 RepID=A0A1Y2ARN9_9TREE|nr:Metallo-dependent phosphatase-like protein [Naematelia encephala]